MINVPYSNKQLRYYLWTGIAYTILGLITVIIEGDYGVLDWFFVWGILHLIVYAILKRQGWLQITQSSIIIRGFLGIGKKELAFSKLTKKKYFAGDYILAQGSKEVALTREFLTPQAKGILDNLIEKDTK
ncbi:hypothetical protein [Dokdonia donghaensis]|uniref:DUF304 domain-containing protein n=1 Tax=Dokdonia donghaensis DSW-1 TaxID=1300343 RepID=A0A0A2GZ65_9FLAO|nr:hypothetical protein [Dokdonia donghaensis]ANH60352.1 hypothetical protein I597_1440 [Dokdonia donghaensis DSW-1]KGO07631.1 hypothetical protein NV36_12800 [Dokdonia donghaensis DSW-1]